MLSQALTLRYHSLVMLHMLHLADTTQSLADLQKALVGSIGMSDQLDALGSCLLNGFLPDAWRKLAPATEKTLGAWMIHFQVCVLHTIHYP
jgi:Dynein heavy chain C-terminal domain